MPRTPFPLGVYVGNPNGNDAVANGAFESQYNAFVHDMGGARPQFMDTFVDYTQDPSQWGANAAWSAWSWALTGNNYVGAGSGTVPLVGVPLANNAGGWSSVDTFCQQIIAGDYNTDYKAIVDAWAGQGYKTVQFRVAYEFDGNFIPWAPGNSSSPTADADFVAAFQHVANLIHEEGAADGITAQVVWNPADINWSSAPPTQLYPGNQYVDIISTDAYSPAYPLDLTTWSSATATTPGPGATSDTAWAASTTDLEHYWQYSNGDQWDPTPGLDSAGWSMQDAIDFAKEMGKPLSISETGAGSNGSGLGPSDDPAFPQWLASALRAAEAAGVTIQNVNIWDTDVSDGSWGFSNGEKLLEEAAWGKYFGATSGGGGTGVPVISAPASAIVAQSKATAIFGVSLSESGNTTGETFIVTLSDTHGDLSATGAGVSGSGMHTLTIAGSLAQVNIDLGTLSDTDSVTPSDTITINASDSYGNKAGAKTIGVAVNGSKSTLTFTDSDGHAYTQPVISSGSLDTYSYQSGLNNNVHQWVAGGVYNVSTDAWAYVVKANINNNTGASFAIYNFMEVDAHLTGATTTAGSAATFTVNTAERGNIELGSGNYDVSFTAANAWGTAAENTVNLTMGSGADTFSLTGSNGVTDAVVRAGPGTDQMSFVGTNNVTVYGGSGTATVSVDSGQNTFVAGTGALNITGHGIADAFVFQAGDGVMTIADFNAAQGDQLRIDASLMSAIQETVRAGGLMISFGNDPMGGLLLQGLTSLPKGSIHVI